MIQDSYFFSDLFEANVCNEKFLSFLEEYSKELQIVIPWDYKKQGCKVYGGVWLREELIHEADRHFYEKRKNDK